MAKLLYKPEDIRTSNMLPDRSSDVFFDPVADASLTQQSMADECDINKLMARYEQPELIPHVNRFKGDYLDLGDGVDYQTALNHIQEARDAFGSLPAGIRKEFNNDPGLFLDFVNDPQNAQALIDMGLATPVSQTQPEAAPAASKPKKTKMVEVPDDEE